MTLEEFPWSVGPRGGIAIPVVELCVIGGIDDIERHVVRVERRKGAKVTATLYER